MRTNVGADKQAGALADPAGEQGTATGITATTLTDSGKAWATNVWAGKQVVIGSVIGTVISNTATVLTVDRWATPSNIGGATATTPATGPYVITPGQAPSPWLAVSTDVAAPAATDTVLASELAGSGWTRAVATYAHGAGAASYTLTKGFTSADATTRSIAKIGVFDAVAGGRMFLESLLAVASGNMLSGDTITITETVNL